MLFNHNTFVLMTYFSQGNNLRHYWSSKPKPCMCAWTMIKDFILVTIIGIWWANKVDLYDSNENKQWWLSPYLELLILGEERGADDLKAWPPILPPVLAADASWTDPSVSTPAATATSANFANLFSCLLLLTKHKH